MCGLKIAIALFYIVFALLVIQATHAAEWKLIDRERTNLRAPLAFASGTMQQPRWFRIDAATARPARLVWMMICPGYFRQGRERVPTEAAVVLRPPPGRAWCHLEAMLFAPIGKRAVLRLSVWGIGGRVIVP